MTTPAWSRALADLVGAPLQALNAERVRGWVTDGLRESEQLDLKAVLYGNGDSQRRELAGDLAAFANQRGGLLILGVGEDDYGAATSLPLVVLTDGAALRSANLPATLRVQQTVTAAKVGRYLRVERQGRARFKYYFEHLAEIANLLAPYQGRPRVICP